MILERFNDLGNTCVPLYDEGKNAISEYTEDETRGLIMINQALYNYKTFRQ